MSKDNGGLSDQRLKERLRALRDINRRHDRGEISDEERRRLHEELTPGFSKHRRRPDAKGQEMTIAEFEKQFPDDAACKVYCIPSRLAGDKRSENGCKYSQYLLRRMIDMRLSLGLQKYLFGESEVRHESLRYLRTEGWRTSTLPARTPDR